jgi:hypothetical protein
MTPEQQDHVVPQLKTLFNLFAAFLGIGTFADLVPVLVGVLSAIWLIYQLYVAIVYELPIKRARLLAIRTGRSDPASTDQAPLT